MSTQKKPPKRQSKSPLKTWPGFLLLGLAIILIGASVWGVTYALLQSQDDKSNDFSIGDVKTELIEEFDPPNQTEVDKPYTKKVSVKNTGEAAVFIRILVSPQILSKEDRTGNRILLPATIGKEIILDLNVSEWKDGEDGYYYYLAALQPGENTHALFTTMTVDSDEVDSTYDESELTIDIKVEGIHTTKWAYQDAWWNGDSDRWSAGVLLSINNQLKTQTIESN